MTPDASARLSLWLEVVSAVAVVISLVFVGLEIRNGTEQAEQNTRALQVAAYQDLINRIVDMNAIDIDDGTNIEALVAVDAPTEAQRQQLAARLWIIFRHGDMAWFQYESGAISEQRMISAMAPVVGRLEFAQVREHWRATRSAFVPSYRAWMDEQVAGFEVAAAVESEP